MALFRFKKNTTEKKLSNVEVISSTKKEKRDVEKEKVEKTIKEVKKKTTTSDVLLLNYKKDITLVLKHPRVTEKATLQSERGVYVFDVASRATKSDVAEAVMALYKITPLKINMVKIPSKRIRIRNQQGKYGVKSGGKKAYIYVKKGDTIDVV